jgi:hypothetical protein
MAGNDSFTVVLLHGNGTDASTTITDDNFGGSAKTWTAQANAQIDTAQQKLGSASILFDGTGDYCSTPDHADFALGSGEFTVDAWVRFNTLATGTWGAGTARTIMSHWVDASRGWAFVVENSGGNQRMLFGYTTNGSGITELVSNTISISTNTWYHMAVDRNNSGTDTITFYLDGVASGNSTTIDAATIFDSTGTGQVGGYDGTNSFMNGWLDEIRLSKGVARYAGAGFTPETVEYAADAGHPAAKRMSGVRFAHSNGRHGPGNLW